MYMDDDSAKSKTFQFSGDSLEYFRIWIVNLLLTILTLGIYSAWAKVRTNRYFYGNTLIHGSGFNYTADPIKILKGRILAVFLLASYQVCLYFYPTVAGYFLIFFLLFLPLVYVMNMAFRMRYTSWRGINFSFSRDYRAAYWVFAPLLIYLILVTLAPLFFGITEEILLDPAENAEEFSSEITFYVAFIGVIAVIAMLGFPLWQKFYYGFIGNRVNYGSADFKFSVSAWQFYKMYLVAFLIVVIGVGLYFLFVYLNFESTMSEIGDAFENVTEDTSEDTTIDLSESLAFGVLVSVFLPFLLLFLPYLMAFAYIRTRLTNIIYSHIQLEGIAFKSTLRFGKMTYLYVTNTLAILFSLGLAIPWSMIRMARYRADNMHVLSENFEVFVAERNDDIDASADAISDLFDLDIGL